jgi:hypothetical protein
VDTVLFRRLSELQQPTGQRLRRFRDREQQPDLRCLHCWHEVLQGLPGQHNDHNWARVPIVPGTGGTWAAEGKIARSDIVHAFDVQEGVHLCLTQLPASLMPLRRSLQFASRCWLPLATAPSTFLSMEDLSLSSLSSIDRHRTLTSWTTNAYSTIPARLDMMIDLAFAITLIRLTQALPLNSSLLAEYDYIGERRRPRRISSSTDRVQSLAVVLLASR